MAVDAGLNADFLDLLAAFSRASVEFIVVGAHALAANGVVRATGAARRTGVVTRHIEERGDHRCTTACHIGFRSRKKGTSSGLFSAFRQRSR